MKHGVAAKCARNEKYERSLPCVVVQRAFELKWKDLSSKKCSEIMAGRKRSWERSQIVRCHCEELQYVHVHCPCAECQGRPVSSSREYAHWQMQECMDLNNL